MSQVNLQEGWLLCKFTEVLDVQGGTQPPKSQFLDNPTEGYIRLLQIRDFGAKPVPTYIPDTTKLKKCEKEDLLIGRYGASLGRICSGMEGAYNVALAKVVSGHFINKKFLKSYLESEMFQQPLALLSRSAQNGFNKEDLATFDFALPPLAEQKVIAEKLDTLLAQVETTKARLERIPEILKSFRQSVLAAAVTGKLTNSDTLAWITRKVDDLAKIVNGKAFPSEDYQEKGIRLLRPGNLHMSGAVIWNAKNTTFIPESWVIKRPELLLREGALLMNLTAQSLADEFLGRVCVFSEQKEVTLLNQRICSFESKLDYDIKPYLFLVFKSPQFRSFVDTLDSGTLIKHLNVKDIKNYTLQLPNEAEQTEIVRRVEQLFAFADSIEQKSNAALARVNNLTQSILAKAFRGELTADWRNTNPDLITGDNSAEALLAKIKVERVKLAKKTKAKV